MPLCSSAAREQPSRVETILNEDGSMKRSVLILFFVASAACHTNPSGAPPIAAPTPPQAATAPAPDPDSIRWVRDAAEYRATLLQVYRQATTRVEAEAVRYVPGAWAVVLDADETVISNVAYQIERAREGKAYSPESWHTWVRRREATPLPGAAAFLERVRALGGRIAIVTNRLQSECADTETLFKAHALPYDAMLCRPDGGSSDKNPRFDAVAAGRTPAGSSPLAIVAFIGDNIVDFPGLSQVAVRQNPNALEPFGARFFILPNPMYGSWQ